jgi:K+-transporting ATPase KdpF subunit
MGWDFVVAGALVLVLLAYLVYSVIYPERF